VTSRAATPARRGKLTREAARREAVDVLTVASAVAAYSARSIGNGLSPAEASRAALATAAELEHVAGTLRRLARLDRLDPPERRRLVAELAASGMSQRAIAAAVGVDKRTVWGDLHRLAAVKAAPSRPGGFTPARRGTERGSRRAAQGGP
jgi:transposase